MLKKSPFSNLLRSVTGIREFPVEDEHVIIQIKPKHKSEFLI